MEDRREPLGVEQALLPGKGLGHSCLPRSTIMFPWHQAASPAVLQPTYRGTESAGSCTSKSGVNEPSFTEG